MDREAWRAAIHGVAKGWTRLSNWSDLIWYTWNQYFCFIGYAKAFDCVDHNKLWKILKDMEIPDHLTCFLRNLYAGQEATVRAGHGTTDWFQIGKGVCQGCILSPLFIYLTYMQSTSWEMRGWKKHKLESRLPGEISITSDMQWHYPKAQSEEELKNLLMKVKEDSEKVGLKLNIQKTKIMASVPLLHGNRWGNSGNSVRLYFGVGSKITADGNCSHEIKRRLLLGRKFMTNLDSIFKSRDITLPTKVHLVKAMVFPVVMYGCKSWTVKKAEHRRIDAFELCVGQDSWESLGLQGDPTSPF